ncbi:putative ankyrin repeat protein [Pseudolycoriella hygida]|uniref:Ankyrin repeat protein n=1 Tax=Pseudolycoriella hygida TaxID=35572 RepID=A0A9Q0S7H2_9DIPT|nr:putative ankyrin repeat protein [Pseudolycoriella hygida]
MDGEFIDFDSLDLETVIEKLCQQNCHQKMIICLTSRPWYTNKSELVDLLEAAMSIRQCSACCDLLINYSNGLYEDEDRFLDENDEAVDQLVECFFPRLLQLVTPRNWTLFEAEHVMLLGVRLNQIEVVRLLLEKYPVLSNSITVYGQSILVHAIICRCFDIARFLLKFHQLDGIRDCDDATLQVACYTKSCPLDIVETILNMGEKKKGFSLKSRLLEPLYNAVKVRRCDIVMKLLEKDLTLAREPLNAKNWSLFHCILAHTLQRDEMLEYVFTTISTNYLNFLHQTIDGDTILHFAIMHKAKFEWISKILSVCPELADLPNATKVTPLMIAAKFNDFFAVEVLIRQHNVNVNFQDAEGKTALDYAIWNDSVEIAKWLLEYGAADVFLVNKKGNNIFNELFKYLRYGVNDDSGKVEMLCDLMSYTYPKIPEKMKEKFPEIFSLFFKTIECLPRFEVLQSWIYSCYLNETNCFRNVIEEFMVEFQLEEYTERNIIVLCLHECVKDLTVEISIQIKLSEELGRCIEDVIYDNRDMNLLIKVAEVLKRNNVINSGISMRQGLFFPNPRVDITKDELKRRLKHFYRAFSRLGLIHIDKTVKYCISEILFNTQQPFETKFFQIDSGILQSQMELMTDEPAPISTVSDIELARNWMTKEDVLISKEYKLIKSYLNPKYINYLTESKEMLPLECLCRSAFRSGLFEKLCKSNPNNLLEAKVKFQRIMRELKVPIFLRNFLNYQY